MLRVIPPIMRDQIKSNDQRNEQTKAKLCLEILYNMRLNQINDVYTPIHKTAQMEFHHGKAGKPNCSGLNCSNEDNFNVAFFTTD